MSDFCQKYREVVKTLRFHSVILACQSILVSEMSAQNVRFLPEIYGSDQNLKVSFGNIHTDIIGILRYALDFGCREWKLADLEKISNNGSTLDDDFLWVERNLMDKAFPMQRKTSKVRHNVEITAKNIWNDSVHQGL